ncbi:MAG: ribosome biogenesis GTPase Der [Pseudomonas fluorescens]|nr:MAG: ribosome biogenesis GTPase Der [Pseudomonas fluorescens]
MNTSAPASTLKNIAILGRPNVGKSTLFNVLARPPREGRTNIVRAATLAITHSQAGTTRDVRRTPGNLFGLKFMLLDTAGIEEGKVTQNQKKNANAADDPTLQASLNRLAYNAAEMADLHILVIDGATGLTPADRALAQKLRKMNKPLILVLNKADLRTAEGHALEVETLGFGAPIMLSAAHSQGMEDLYHALKVHVPEIEDEPEEDEAEVEETEVAESVDGEDEEQGPETDVEADYSRFPKRPAGAIRLAILGRPNVGKSTLTNALLGREAMLTGPVAGLTREAVPHDFEYNEQAFQLIDTPGLRRKAKVDKDSLEFLSVGQSLQAVEKADVVILVIDASTHNTDTGNWEIFEQQDAQIAAVAMNQYKPLIIALNKWDSVKDKNECKADIAIQLHHRMHAMSEPLAMPISALKAKGLDDLMGAVCDVFEKTYSTYSTGKLNNLLARVLAKRSPPLANGKVVSLKFIRQSDTNPPTFTFWGNRISEVSDTYKQFLRNQLSEALGLGNLPVKIFFKANKNPYKGRKPGWIKK